jgi:hypothetical protein
MLNGSSVSRAMVFALLRALVWRLAGTPTLIVIRGLRPSLFGEENRPERGAKARVRQRPISRIMSTKGAI